MKVLSRLLITAAGMALLASAASAQCSNAIINDAFKQAGLTPYQTQADADLAAARAAGNNPAVRSNLYLPQGGECNPARYAGGNFQTPGDLAPLVQASRVCQDPWIAQAYLKQGRPINGHKATELDSVGPGSTQGQCNIATYRLPDGRGGMRQDGWSDFNGLLDALNRHFSPSATPAAPSSPPATVSQVTLQAPATWQSGKPVTISWTPSLSTRCADGVRLQGAGGIFGNDYNIVGRLPNSPNSYTFNAPTVTSGTQVSLTLLDKCTGTRASNTVNVTITGPSVMITIQGRQVPINPSGPLVTTAGDLVDAVGQVVADPAHKYYIDRNLVLKTLNVSSNVVAAGAGNVVAAGAGNVVAAGGGNVVAAGGGNVVAAGGGNVVAAGGGNVVLQLAPDRIFRSVQGGYAIDALGQRILQAGSNVTFRNNVLVGSNSLALLTDNGGALMSDASGSISMKSLSSAQLQQVLSGSIMNPNLGAGQIMNPNLGAGQVIAIDPSRISGGQLPGVGAQISGGQLPGGGAQIMNPNLGAGQVIAIDAAHLLVDANRLAPARSLQAVSPYSVSRFAPVATSWANKTAATFQWTPSGTPGNTTAIVKMQLAGKSYSVCGEVSVSRGRCQTQVVDWSREIRFSSGATFSLVESGTSKVLATYSTSFTVKVP